MLGLSGTGHSSNLTNLMGDRLVKRQLGRKQVGNSGSVAGVLCVIHHSTVHDCDGAASFLWLLRYSLYSFRCRLLSIWQYRCGCHAKAAPGEWSHHGRSSRGLVHPCRGRRISSLRHARASFLTPIAITMDTIRSSSTPFITLDSRWFLQLYSLGFAARPCQRCIKRGMADNCTEGHRKKAKYLLDDEELGVFSYFGLVPSRSYADHWV